MKDKIIFLSMFELFIICSVSLVENLCINRKTTLALHTCLVKKYNVICCQANGFFRRNDQCSNITKRYDNHVNVVIQQTLEIETGPCYDILCCTRYKRCYALNNDLISWFMDGSKPV